MEVLDLKSIPASRLFGPPRWRFKYGPRVFMRSKSATSTNQTKQLYACFQSATLSQSHKCDYQLGQVTISRNFPSTCAKSRCKGHPSTTKSRPLKWSWQWPMTWQQVLVVRSSAYRYLGAGDLLSHLIWSCLNLKIETWMMGIWKVIQQRILNLEPCYFCWLMNSMKQLQV